MRLSLALSLSILLAACDATDVVPTAPSPLLGYWTVEDPSVPPFVARQTLASGDLRVTSVEGGQIEGYVNASVLECDGRGACVPVCQVSGPFRSDLRGGRFAVRLSETDLQLPLGTTVESELIVLDLDAPILRYRMRLVSAGACQYDEIVTLERAE